VKVAAKCDYVVFSKGTVNTNFSNMTISKNGSRKVLVPFRNLLLLKRKQLREIHSNRKRSHRLMPRLHLTVLTTRNEPDVCENRFL